MINARPWFAAAPEFRRLLAGSRHLRLARLALEFGLNAYPGLDIPHYLGILEHLAARIWEPSDPEPHDSHSPLIANPRALLERVLTVLHREEGFRGNTLEYYDIRNSFLHEVLERRLGIPISLCILYQDVCARVGLDVGGVNLPGHFVLRWDGVSLCGGETVGDGEHPGAAGQSGGANAFEPVFLDPFHGVFLDRAGCEQRVAEVVGQEIALTDAMLAPCSMRVVAARLLRNLKANYLRTADFDRVLPVQRHLWALTPEDAEETRDLGVISLRTGHPGDALDCLNSALRTQPPFGDRENLLTLLRVAKRALAIRN